MKLSRRQFIKLSAASTVALGLGGIGLGAWLRTRVQLSNVTVNLPHLPAAFDGLTIAHLSDIHYGQFIPGDYVQRCVEIANDLNPDLIALTGDFTAGAKAYSEPCGEILSGLKARIGKFAVLGNHDYYNSAGRVTRALRQAGITVLIDDKECLEKKGEKLWLFGVDELAHGNTDLVKLYRDCPPNETRITLAHNPDFIDEYVHKQQHTDFMLSGHTHGGQIRFPLLGAPHMKLLGHEYVMGLQRRNTMQIYTTRGIGTVGPPVRFLCPPEIVLYTLRRGEITI
ncbi:MAG TPA: metallophosphoesterase [Blastocatellia bacterium]|nr:metallophosphoesterase [Blastocatellia bacterium]